MSRGLLPVTKYVGGIVQLRDRAGSGRLPFTPVAAAQQREALKILNDGLFSVDSFTFKPEFLASLPHSRLDYFDALTRGEVNRQPMVSVPATILRLQREVLDQLMSDVVATRLMESQAIAKKGESVCSRSSTINIQDRSGRVEDRLRRFAMPEPQREHHAAWHRHHALVDGAIRRCALAAARTRRPPEPRAAQGKTGLSKETRAHYAESSTRSTRR